MPRIRKATSEQRIDERRNRGARGERDEAAEDDQHQDDRQQPIFLAYPEKLPKLQRDTHAAPSELPFHGTAPEVACVADDPVSGPVWLSSKPKRISSRQTQEEARGHKRR